MSNISKKIANVMQDAGKSKTSAYDTPATIKRIEGKTAWVHIPGGVDETPVKMTISAKKGDTVQVRVSDGTAFLVGNASAPPTDDSTANTAVYIASNAEVEADTAHKAAVSAVSSAAEAAAAAGRAETSASAALLSAQSAQTSADSALVSLSTVEDVVGVLNWITAHGTMTLTTDTAINPAHVYFVVDAAGDYEVGGTRYSIVAEPDVAQISTYYELSVDESVQNYVATHVVVDTEGLWLVPDSGGNKVLIATGAGSSYTTAGTYIIGKVNGLDTVFAKFTTDGITMNATTSVQIAHLGYGEGTAQSGTANAPYYTLGERSSQYTNYSSSSTYSVGEVVKYNNKYYVCKTAITTAEAWNSAHWQPAIGNYSVAENYNTIASGASSHAEGGNFGGPSYPKAVGYASHAEGGATVAGASYAHAEGSGTTALGSASHAGGTNTVAGYAYQTTIGKYNNNKSTSLFEIGNGTADNARSNAFEVDSSGNVNIPTGAKYKINGTALSASDISNAVSTSNVTTSGESGKIPQIKSDGVLELRKYIDLHDTSSTTDYDVRVTCGSTTGTDGGASLNFTCGSFRINSNTVADFVTEQGTNSSWYYRKWKSGKVEAWREYDAGSQTPSQWVTGWYYKDIDIAIPSGLFSSTPTYVNATNIGSDYQFMVFCAVPRSSTEIRVRVVKPNSGGASPLLSIYASNM